MQETRRILILNQLSFKIQIYQVKSWSHQLNLKKTWKSLNSSQLKATKEKKEKVAKGIDPSKSTVKYVKRYRFQLNPQIF